MNIQLALDRMNVEDAIALTKKVEPFVDWIEVGTSLIKEFGVGSVAALKEAFPDKTIVADMKTIDNAVYECKIAFDAGADVVTVMGVSPAVTIEACLDEAKKRKKRIMIDLLNTSNEVVAGLLGMPAIFCLHTSKDEQEMRGGGFTTGRFDLREVEVAIAGGITLENMESVSKFNPAVVIIGSAITKAADPGAAAKQFRTLLEEGAN